MNLIKSLRCINYVLIGSFSLLLSLWVSTYVTTVFNVYSGILAKYDVVSKPYLKDYVLGMNFISGHLLELLFWIAVSHASIGIFLQYLLRDSEHIIKVCVAFGYFGVLLALAIVSFVIVFVLKPLMPFHL